MSVVQAVQASDLAIDADGLAAYLRADERDFFESKLPELPHSRSGFMLSSSSLRGLGDRWNMHRSGRFGWHRSWKGKDRFQHIADLAWPPARAVLRWGGGIYHVPRYAAYRVIVSEVLRELRERETTAVCFHLPFNPLIALVVGSRMAQLRVDVVALSRLGFLEIERFLQLELLPSYILDFSPSPLVNTSAHRNIRLHEFGEPSSPSQCLAAYIHDLCDFPVDPAVIKAVRASGSHLIVGPADLLSGVAIQAKLIFDLDGRPYALAWSGEGERQMTCGVETRGHY